MYQSEMLGPAGSILSLGLQRIGPAQSYMLIIRGVLFVD